MKGLMGKAAAKSAPGVHDKVIELLVDVSGRVLDAPSGEGALSNRLAGLGLDVIAVDNDESSFKAADSGITFAKLDLNMALPYTESSFDCVVCVEGAEHIENIHHLMRQFAHVLKPGGKLIITTPNIMNVASKIKFLLFGSFRYFNSKIEIRDTSLAGHIYPITFQELEYALKRSGFAIEEITTNTDMSRWRILRSAVSAISRVINRAFNKAYNDELALSELVFGDIIIIGARRGK